MKSYSDYTITYVNDICMAANKAGFTMSDPERPFAIENIENLTDFLHHYVVMSFNLNKYLEENGLVNRGRCPYTGEQIDNRSPKWTYMHTRSIYVSPRGFEIMQKEQGENFERIMGRPMPKIKNGGCYIATLCYGDEYAPEVIILKEFRDNILSDYAIGKICIGIYYSISPSLASLLKNKKRINRFIRANLLDRIVQKLIGH